MDLGANLPFDRGQADFSGMRDKSNQEQLFLSAVFHQAVVEVNEEGTEAAAATGAVMVTYCMMDPIEFNCNKPFLFIIHDKIKSTPLFFGKYAKP